MNRAALLVFLAACGRVDFDPRTDATVATSTRLKQVWNVFEDGPRLPETLYDTQLAIRCDPMATTAGTIACLPRDATLAYYTDAACTQGVAQADDPAVRYAYDSFYPPIERVYALGAPVADPTALYTRQYDGSCAAAGNDPAGPWYALTEAPFPGFAPLTAEYGAEGRLVSQQLVAPDGFRTPAPLHDTMASGDCIAATLDDGTICELYTADVAMNYTDSGCTQLVLHAYVQVQYAFELVNTPVCKTADLREYALGAELPRTTPIWLKIPGSTTCAATAVAQGRRLFSLGPPIPLAAVTRQPVPGARIQAIDDAAGAAHATEYYAYDSQLGFECQPQTAVDGVVRCLPSRPAYANAYFSDAGCTQPLMLAAYGQPACATLPPLIIEDPAGPHVYRPGTKYTLPFYSGSPANCTMVTPSSDEYTLGAEIPPASFAAVTEQIDP